MSGSGHFLRGPCGRSSRRHLHEVTPQRGGAGGSLLTLSLAFWRVSA